MTLDIESEIIEEFVPSFPVLEYLRMANMEWRDSDRVTVSSASLRSLCLHATGCEGYVNPKSISFDIPNLHYLSKLRWFSCGGLSIS
uniref:F-box/LRR-repeat protein n=1 Tax=Noccaea caerulescens TaxID=107243 RepID=A0A1J3GGI1_NOCCA